jgi:hypothetical protein
VVNAETLRAVARAARAEVASAMRLAASTDDLTEYTALRIMAEHFSGFARSIEAAAERAGEGSTE